VRTKLVLTDEDVKKMAAAAEAHAAANQWHVTVAIFDDGGHLLNLHRMEGVAASTVEMAIGKGRTGARPRSTKTSSSRGVPRS
jgi:glc operon protein GlcG